MLTYRRGQGWVEESCGVKCVDARGRKRVMYHRQPQKGEAGFSCGEIGFETHYKTADGFPKWDACIRHVRTANFSEESIHVGSTGELVYVTVLFDDDE